MREGRRKRGRPVPSIQSVSQYTYNNGIAIPPIRDKHTHCFECRVLLWQRFRGGRGFCCYILGNSSRRRLGGWEDGFVIRHDVLWVVAVRTMAPPKSSLALDSGTDEVARWAEPLSVARGGGGGLVSDVNGRPLDTDDISLTSRYQQHYRLEDVHSRTTWI